MASKNKNSSEIFSQFDEKEWVVQIRTSIEKEGIKEGDINIPVSIVRVPQTLVSYKPEDYVPQLVAFGPYHHWQPELYDMERYKLEACRRIQASLNGIKFNDIVQDFIKCEYEIRYHYDKYLELNAETLGWMMAIDASFILEFLHNSYAENKGDSIQQTLAKTSSNRVDDERRKLGFNTILRDTSLLENQIPLFLLRKLFNFVYSSKELAEKELSTMLIRFVKEVCPFKIMDDSLPIIDNTDPYAHLLELLYFFILPKTKEPSSELNETSEHNNEAEVKEEAEPVDATNIKRACNWVWKLFSNANGGPTGFIKNNILPRLNQIPWQAITAPPVMPAPSADSTEMPPLVEEITIPSVTELVRAGVKFKPTIGDLRTIKFDTETVTMHLPVINLDTYTEVIFRNLVAYEALVVAGPLVLTRYVELLHGIIDKEQDVKILRENGIVMNRLMSNGEAAEMWNGMSKSMKLNKVGFLDKAIGDVNEYYTSRWSVKNRLFMNKYIFGSWKVLTFLATGLLLLLTCVQAFCSVYGCSARVTNLTKVD